MSDLSKAISGVGSNPNRAIAALLFLNASTNAMDVFSALNSSPWTAENFGADPEKAASCRGYVYRSIAFSTGYCVAASVLAHSWWPIIGALLADAYMYYLYEKALKKGKTAGSAGWAKG